MLLEYWRRVEADTVVTSHIEGRRLDRASVSSTRLTTFTVEACSARLIHEMRHSDKVCVLLRTQTSTAFS